MKGTYLLVIELKKSRWICIGKHRTMFFHKGHYVYVGSALNGIEGRVHRHLRHKKNLFWHIDFLLCFAQIKAIYYREGNHREECVIAQQVKQYLATVPGFGASECKCGSHLFHGSFSDIKNILSILKLTKFRPVQEKS